MCCIDNQGQSAVVPRCRRQEVLDVAQKGLVGGHFSHGRMIANFLLKLGNNLS